jgi:sterol desaturase/sphingolipid hydroxylase (fatty acid hydroxylase superfamily)
MSRSDLILLLALALVFTPLEWLRPVRRVAVDWARLRTDVLHVFFSGSLVRLGVAALSMGLMWAAAPVLPHGLGLAVRSQPGWLQFVEIFLISDFAFYCAHRMIHATPWLWRFHEVHHSSEKLDWIAGHRLHPIDQTLQASIIAAPTVLLGFSPEPFLAFALIYRWHAEFTHANIRVNFGPLRWLIASPQYHHWHHADEPEAWDHNFGGQLVIFDWLFGTLHLPDRMPAKYGLSAPIAKDYIGQLLHPFRRRDAAPAEPAQPAPSLSGS